MTHNEFINSHEYKSSSESAKYVYQERIAIIMEAQPASDKPDFFQHQIAYEDFRQAVELERGLK